MRLWLCSCVALVSSAAVGCSGLGQIDLSKAVVANTPAPDFELTDMKGAKVRLSAFRGKPVLLTFWAAG